MSKQEEQNNKAKVVHHFNDGTWWCPPKDRVRVVKCGACPKGCIKCKVALDSPFGEDYQQDLEGASENE